MKSKVYRFEITEEDAAERLDQILCRRLPEFSRTRARQIIDLGGVHLDGRRARRCGQAVAAGTQVEMFLDGYPLPPWAMSSADILAEDSYLLVVNKPAGVDTQPTPARYKGTLYQALLAYLEKTRGRDRVELGMVQRLDRGTSGAMVFSVHRRAHRGLTEILRQRQADKRYLALVEGAPQPEAGEYRSLLARNRASNLVRSVARGGKEAITRYRTLAVLAKATLVEVQLVTGRSHQIRAHFSEAGHPLLGDGRYGGQGTLAGLALEHPLLHSWRLSFRHPMSGEEASYTAPLPPLWSQVWGVLGREPADLETLLAAATAEPANQGRTPC